MTAATTDPVAASIAAYRAHHGLYAATRADAGLALFDRFAARLKPRSRVLDAGCGPGRDVARLVRRGHRPTGLDLCPEFLTAASRHAPCVLADVRDIPFPDGTFDAVWACASLVHLDDAGTVRALSELRRVTTVGGPLCVSVKGDGTAGWRTSEIGTRWFNTWTPQMLSAAASPAGFARSQVESDGCWVTLWAVT